MASGCKGFLLQLELCLATVHPTPSGGESVNVLVGHAVWEGPDSVRDHYPEFTRFRAMFDHPPEGRVAGERLFHLRQKTRSAQDSVLE